MSARADCIPSRTFSRTVADDASPPEPAARSVEVTRRELPGETADTRPIARQCRLGDVGRRPGTAWPRPVWSRAPTAGPHISLPRLVWRVAALMRTATGSVRVATVTAADIIDPPTQGLDSTHAALLAPALGSGAACHPRLRSGRRRGSDTC
ncbi:hypothetical protein ABT186_01135 [Streptomyces sp. NPDC001634]|uniref:GntT/GntP/DsdX family permease n=1 Tax=Streptomyces sp. NPDC001634 TaxID=3154390 RepID=UPI00332E383B